MVTQVNTRFRWIIALCVGILFCNLGCKSDAPVTPPTKEEKPAKPRVTIPKFERDSAYAFIEKQLSFGFRIPGTKESHACKDWMVSKLKSYGAQVVEQSFKASFMDVKDAQAYNVIAEINPEKKQRVLLCAHWDSRKVAEKDSDEDRKEDPIMGADDGASGVAVLIEIARLISQNEIDLGVDIVLFDAEDQGDDPGGTKSWCLGSQYWSKNPHKAGYNADFGILLDMIAAEGANFTYEGHSSRYAPKVMEKIWTLAHRMGKMDLFKKIKTGAITDDHYWVNLNLGIPTVDIINRPQPNTNGHGFGDYHHTHNDDISIISKKNLGSVGQVVTATLYRTSDGSF